LTGPDDATYPPLQRYITPNQNRGLLGRDVV